MAVYESYKETNEEKIKAREESIHRDLRDLEDTIVQSLI